VTRRTASHLGWLAVAALAGALLLGACSLTKERWTGSVDAVFRYRTEERSTVVYEVRPGSLSEAAGVKPGDVLLAVDGEDVTQVSYDGIRAALRGPVGTIAKLTVDRGGAIHELEVERRPTRKKKKSADAD
jgi:C-terminal processing protease CtpA/Prc